MKKVVKKALPVLLTALMLANCLGLTAFAYSGDGEFKYGIGPTAEYQLDYVYYQPEGDGSHPLVVWLHGLGHGKYPGDQLNGNEIENWTGSDYQSRFKNADGAYILCPRSPENKNVTWLAQGMEEALMALICSFIDEHPDVDTNRIYIGGFSLGGYMTIKMCRAYPDYFAAAFPICPAVPPWDDDVSGLENIPMWVTTSTLDRTVPYDVVYDFWAELMKVTNVIDDCRISLLDQVRGQDGRKITNNHYSWYAVTSDMFMTGKQSYSGMRTYNGYGASIQLSYPDGMISWLSGFSK